MQNLTRPSLGRGRLAVAALALAGVLILHPDPAAAEACSDVLSTSTGNLIGSAAGGAAGGLLGNQFGSGSGKGAMTALGVVGGALAGGYAGRKVDGCGNAPQRAAAPQAAHRAPRRGAATPARAAAEPATCRAVLTQAVIDGREQQMEGIACLDPDGVWRTASGAAAEQAATADLVLRTQQRLRDQGFYVRDNIDGKWGPSTSGALRNFQRANGLTANGQLDGATRTSLGLDPAPIAAAAPTAAPMARSAEPAPAVIAERVAAPGAAAPAAPAR
jgi:surface antigen